jgi:hypothetical protein
MKIIRKLMGKAHSLRSKQLQQKLHKLRRQLALSQQKLLLRSKLNLHLVLQSIQEAPAESAPAQTEAPVESAPEDNRETIIRLRPLKMR